MKNLLLIVFIFSVKYWAISQDSEFDLIKTVPGFDCIDGIYSTKYKEIIILTGQSKIYYSTNFTKTWHEITSQKSESQIDTENENYEYEEPYIQYMHRKIYELADGTIILFYNNTMFSYHGKGALKIIKENCTQREFAINENGTIYTVSNDSVFTQFYLNDSLAFFTKVADIQGKLLGARANYLFFWELNTDSFLIKRLDANKSVKVIFRMENRNNLNRFYFKKDAIYIEPYSIYKSNDYGDTWVDSRIESKTFDHDNQISIEDNNSKLKINWDNSKMNKRYFISGKKNLALFTNIKSSPYWDISNVNSDQWILFTNSEIKLFSHKKVKELKYPYNVAVVYTIASSSRKGMIVKTDEGYFITKNNCKTWRKLELQSNYSSYIYSYKVGLKGKENVSIYHEKPKSITFFHGLKVREIDLEKINKKYNINIYGLAYGKKYFLSTIDSNLYIIKRKLQQVKLPLEPTTLFFDPPKIYCSNDTSIYYSKDMEKNWNSMGIQNCNFIEIECVLPNGTLYYSSSDGLLSNPYIKLYRTNDFGKNIILLDSAYRDTHISEKHKFFPNGIIQKRNEFYRDNHTLLNSLQLVKQFPNGTIFTNYHFAKDNYVYRIDEKEYLLYKSKEKLK